MEDRVHLLHGMDRLRRDMDASGLVGAMDEFSQRAYQMTTNETGAAGEEDLHVSKFCQ